MRRSHLAILPLLLLTGCLVGPDYRRPDYPIPAQFRGETAETPTAPVPLGELAWWQVFGSATQVMLAARFRGTVGAKLNRNQGGQQKP